LAEINNPYAPPRAKVEDVVVASGEAYAVRTEHIKREAEIRAIGSLYYLGAAGLCFAIFGLMSSPARVQNPHGPSVPVLLAVCVGGAALLIFLGTALRRMRPWARIVGIVFAALGLLNFPAGTVINAYILYLLLSEKGRRIFQSDYADIVAATPDVKYKMSIVTRIAIGFLVAVLLVGAVIIILGRLRHM
jgi:hypothetical protein